MSGEKNSLVKHGFLGLLTFLNTYMPGVIQSTKKAISVFPGGISYAHQILAVLLAKPEPLSAQADAIYQRLIKGKPQS